MFILIIESESVIWNWTWQEKEFFFNLDPTYFRPNKICPYPSFFRYKSQHNIGINQERVADPGGVDPDPNQTLKKIHSENTRADPDPQPWQKPRV